MADETYLRRQIEEDKAAVERAQREVQRINRTLQKSRRARREFMTSLKRANAGR